jgi:hypothetical protein
MRISFFHAGALLLGLCAPSPVEACSCDVGRVSTAIERHQLIATGRIANLHWLDARNVVQVTITVEQMLKGSSHNRLLTVYTRQYGTSCYGYDFRIGRRFLVFARDPTDPREAPMESLTGLPDGGHIVELCGGSVSLDTGPGNERLKAVQQRLAAK